VLELRRLDSRQTRDAEFAAIRCDLHLAGQRQHVGCEASGEEQGGLILARDSVRMALLEHMREIRQAVGEQVDGNGVNGDFHWLPPRGGVNYRARHLNRPKRWRACPSGETIRSHFRGIAPGVSHLWAPAQLAVLAKV